MENTQVKSKSRLPWIYLDDNTSAYHNFIHLWQKTKIYTANQLTKVIYQCKNRKKHGCVCQIREEKFYSGAINYYQAYSHKYQCINNIQDDDCISSAIRFAIDKNMVKAFDIKQYLSCNNIVKNALQINDKVIYNIISYENKKRQKSMPYLTTDILLRKSNEMNSLLLSNNDKVIVKCETNPIRIFFSTENRIKELEKAKNIHIDGTYKVNDLNYPLICMGYSDICGTFHLIALAIIETESSAMYSWVLNKLIFESEVYGIVFNPEACIADCADAISLGLEDVLPHCKRIHCWAHVLRRLKLKCKMLKDKSKEILDDIYFLQLMFDEKTFDSGAELFYAKWSQHRESKSIADYIKKEYFIKNRNWYEGFNVFAPSTNNCIESFNRTLKRRYLKYSKKPLLVFMELILNIFEDSLSSKKQIFDKMQYYEASLVTTEHTTFIFDLLQTDSKSKIYYINDKNISQETKVNISGKLFGCFKTFNEFKDFYKANTFLIVDHELLSYENIRCTCRFFLKTKKCVHIYLYLKKSNNLSIIDQSLVSKKKSRGRPKKVKHNDSLNKDIF